MTGALMLMVFALTLAFVKESFTREHSKSQRMKEVWASVPQKSLTLTLFVTFFVLTVALYSIEPIMTVYVTELSRTASHVALIAGLTFSASGLANIIAAPRLGRLSDRIGAYKVILFALIAAGLIFIPQAYVRSPWELMGLRFCWAWRQGAGSLGIDPGQKDHPGGTDRQSVRPPYVGRLSGCLRRFCTRRTSGCGIRHTGCIYSYWRFAAD